MSKSRADKLYDIGRNEWDLAMEQGSDGFVSPRPILKAMAAMIAEATKPKTRKKVDGPKLVLSPQKVYETIRDLCGHQIACTPYNSRWFGRLGKELQGIPELQEEDLDRLVGWINSGALRSWPTTLTFDHVVKHISGWIVKARKWAEGNTNAPKIGDAFK